ncbi:hypothetical protein BD560DRAFT_429784 [Blakeslea trispora]|nr:hypothetical protein BD560DRAFT_429784 [Blakeslea trispora]
MPRELVVSPSTSSSHLDTFYSIFRKCLKRGAEEGNLIMQWREEGEIISMSAFMNYALLLPERLLDTAPTSSNVMSVSNGQVGANGTPRRSIRYQERIKELEQMIEAAKTRRADTRNKASFRRKRIQAPTYGLIQFRQQFK